MNQDIPWIKNRYSREEPAFYWINERSQIGKEAESRYQQIESEYEFEYLLHRLFFACLV